jgi:hypothetical protein
MSTHSLPHVSQVNIFPWPWTSMCCFKSELVANAFLHMSQLNGFTLSWTWNQCYDFAHVAEIFLAKIKN